MPKNTITDLNNMLYEQLERLRDADHKKGKIEDEEFNLDDEIKRSNAMVGVASKIIDNQKVALNAMRLMNKGDLNQKEVKGFLPKIGE